MSDDKKSEVVTVRLSDSVRRFVEVRCKQESMESPGEYIRALIDADRQRASVNFNLLAEALGVQVNKDYISNQ